MKDNHEADGNILSVKGWNKRKRNLSSLDWPLGGKLKVTRVMFLHHLQRAKYDIFGSTQHFALKNYVYDYRFTYSLWFDHHFLNWHDWISLANEWGKGRNWDAYHVIFKKISYSILNNEKSCDDQTKKFGFQWWTPFLRHHLINEWLKFDEKREDSFSSNRGQS